MLGFKRFRSAATTISGIELMHLIREGQFDLATLGLKEPLRPLVGMSFCLVDIWQRGFLVTDCGPTYTDSLIRW
jgi:hypothetical protein